jgi:hypothetical protein
MSPDNPRKIPEYSYSIFIDEKGWHAKAVALDTFDWSNRWELLASLLLLLIDVNGLISPGFYGLCVVVDGPGQSICDEHNSERPSLAINTDLRICLLASAMTRAMCWHSAFTRRSISEEGRG